MKTNPKQTRKYIVSRCEKLRLWFQPKYKRWTMTGGRYGSHDLFAPHVYNARVAAHWEGYMKNNGMDPVKSEFNDYEKD